MRIQKILLAASALVLLSSCSEERFHDFGAWYSNKPSNMERKWGPMTTGYFGQNNAGRDVINPRDREAPTREEMHPPKVDDGLAVEETTDDTTVVTSDDMSPVTGGNYGKKVDQLYFAHGSAHIGKTDHRHLAVDAKKIKKNPGTGLTVVGHASHRVNTTNDPVRKKEINFEVAQKRANAVTNTLTHDGVDPGWVVAVSKGDEEPNPHPGKRSQESSDRRVEIYMNQ